ncbi:MAG: DsbA family protein [Actinobacteria bacterium]|nr:DsbA family protein [Actinomycetota bacterium]
MDTAVEPAVVVWSDIACPWAHVAVARLWRYRERLGLAHAVRFDHRAFPLELVNGRPTPKRVLDAEVPVTHAIEPGAGWQVWQRPDSEWPASSLPALEAVQAVKQSQGLAAAEALDRALRRALFAESRCLSVWSEVLDAARRCGGVDVDDLDEGFRTGRGRAAVVAQWQASQAEDSPVKGSPHVFLPDGTDAHNPGVVMHWAGEHGKGFPIIEADDPSVYEKLLACFTPAA